MSGAVAETLLPPASVKSTENVEPEMNSIRPAIKGRTACRSFQKSVKKKGKLSTSHRYNLLPLLPSGPGGIQRELVVYDFPDANIVLFGKLTKLFVKIVEYERQDIIHPAEFQYFTGAHKQYADRKSVV